MAPWVHGFMLHFINKRSKMFNFKTFKNMKLLYSAVTKDL